MQLRIRRTIFFETSGNRTEFRGSQEVQFRYGKTHSTWDKLRDAVSSCPRNIPSGPRTPFAIAMKHYPQCIVENDPVESYRKYYNEAKASFAKWTKRAIPEWYHV